MVFKEDFDVHIKGVSPWRELDNPYFLLFNQIIALTVSSIKELGKRTLDISDAKVEFVFDEQGRLGRDALGWWDVLKQALEPEKTQLLGAPSEFASDKRQSPLQAADLLAWSVRNVAEDGESSGRGANPEKDPTLWRICQRRTDAPIPAGVDCDKRALLVIAL